MPDKSSTAAPRGGSEKGLVDDSIKEARKGSTAAPGRPPAPKTEEVDYFVAPYAHYQANGPHGRVYRPGEPFPFPRYVTARDGKKVATRPDDDWKKVSPPGSKES